MSQIGRHKDQIAIPLNNCAFRQIGPIFVTSLTSLGERREVCGDRCKKVNKGRGRKFCEEGGQFLSGFSPDFHRKVCQGLTTFHIRNHVVSWPQKVNRRRSRLLRYCVKTSNRESRRIAKNQRFRDFHVILRLRNVLLEDLNLIKISADFTSFLGQLSTTPEDQISSPELDQVL